MFIVSDSEIQTIMFGRKLAKMLGEGDIVCLRGGLGSGKTVLAKGIARGLGIDDGEVVSPTFVLMRCYEGRLPMYHFDLYRLGETSQITGLGYEEYLFGRGISVIEWPQRLNGLMPKEYLLVELKQAGSKKRKIYLKGFGGRYAGLVRRIGENTRS